MQINGKSISDWAKDRVGWVAAISAASYRGFLIRVGNFVEMHTNS
jgi:hypothetical protein